MRYVLDTDIIIFFLKGQVEVVKKFSQLRPDDLGTTIFNYSELLFGAHNSQRVSQNLAKIEAFMENIRLLDFDEEAAKIFAIQKAELSSEGVLIADIDLMVASICIANDLTLVTNNIRHFDRLVNLKLENWIVL